MNHQAKSQCPKCGSEVHGHVDDNPSNNIGLRWRCKGAGCSTEWDAKESDIEVVNKPVHRLGVSFIGAVPDGAKLMAFNDQIFLVAPGMAPCFVTPTGLVPVQNADGSEVE